MVTYLLHGYPSLLHDFACDGVFKALSWLDKAGHGRIPALGPVLLAPEQAPIAIGHQHNDCRVDTWKSLSTTIGRCTRSHVPGFSAQTWTPAAATELVVAMPDHHATRIGEQRSLFLRQESTDVVEVAKLGIRPRQVSMVVFELEREAGVVAEVPEVDQLLHMR